MEVAASAHPQPPLRSQGEASQAPLRKWVRLRTPALLSPQSRPGYAGPQPGSSTLVSWDLWRQPPRNGGKRGQSPSASLIYGLVYRAGERRARQNRRRAGTKIELEPRVSGLPPNIYDVPNA